MVSGVVALIAKILFEWWGWLFIVIFFAYQIWQNQRRTAAALATDHTVLLLEVPLSDQPTEVQTEHLFSKIHGILRPRSELRRKGLLQEHVSFEVVAVSGYIRFYIWTPEHLLNYVNTSLTEAFPTIAIYKVDDYARRDFSRLKVIETQEFGLRKSSNLPIKNYHEFDSDPLGPLMSVLSELNDDSEELWLQFLARPVDGTWKYKQQQIAEKLKNSASDTLFSQQSHQARLSEHKTTKLGYESKIRVAYLGNSDQAAAHFLEQISNAFLSFTDPTSNSLVPSKRSSDKLQLRKFQARYFRDQGNLLAHDELAGLWHPPYQKISINTAVQTTLQPQVEPKWSAQEDSAPPFLVPLVRDYQADDISPIGLTKINNNNEQFGLPRSDRQFHVLAVGNNNTGKTGLLELMALSDIYNGHGVTVVDIDNDLARRLLRRIPAERSDDVAYWDMTNYEYAFGFNPLNLVHAQLALRQAETVAEALRPWFRGWNTQYDYILSRALHALIEFQGTTLLDVPLFLTDQTYRNSVLEGINDHETSRFFAFSYQGWFEEHQNTVIRPLISQLKQFLFQASLRNSLTQTSKTFDFLYQQENHKILLVHAPVNELGEGATITANLVLSMTQLSAMARNIEDTAHETHMVYIERTEKLSAYEINRMINESQTTHLQLNISLRDITTVASPAQSSLITFSGTQILFNQPEASARLLKDRLGTFKTNSVSRLENREYIISQTVNKHIIPTFAGNTLTLPPPINMPGPIVERSQEKHCLSRYEVEQKLHTLGVISRRQGVVTQENFQTASSYQPLPRNKDSGKLYHDDKIDLKNT
jgi:hypothetical protein